MPHIIHGRGREQAGKKIPSIFPWRRGRFLNMAFQEGGGGEERRCFRWVMTLLHPKWRAAHSHETLEKKDWTWGKFAILEIRIAHFFSYVRTVRTTKNSETREIECPASSPDSPSPPPLIHHHLSTESVGSGDLLSFWIGDSVFASFSNDKRVNAVNLFRTPLLQNGKKVGRKQRNYCCSSFAKKKNSRWRKLEPWTRFFLFSPPLSGPFAHFYSKWAMASNCGSFRASSSLPDWNI